MPLDPEVVGAGIGAAGSIIGDVANLFGQSKANKQSQKFQEKMYGQQRADALSDWNMQNSYNSPSSIMDRYKKAGLNPNLIYGNSGNAAPAVRSSSPGSFTAQAPTFRSGAAIGQAFSQIYDVKAKKAETNNLLAQNAVIAQEAIQKAILNKKLTTESNMKEIDLQYYDKLVQANLRDVQQSGNVKDADATNKNIVNRRLDENENTKMNMLWQQLDNLKTNNNKEQATVDLIKQQVKNLGKDATIKDFEIKLNKSNLTKGDSLESRMVLKILSMLGINF